MANYRVTVIAVADDGEETELGTTTVVAETKADAQAKAMDELWDSRLDSASCSAVFNTVPV